MTHTQPGDPPPLGETEHPGSEPEDLGPIGEALVPAPTPGEEWRRERTREFLAYAVLALLGASVLIPLIAVAFLDHPWREMSDLVSTLYPGLLGVGGTVLGFYFGTKDRK